MGQLIKTEITEQLLLLDPLANIQVLGRKKDEMPYSCYVLEGYEEQGFIFEHDNWYIPYALTENVLKQLIKSYPFNGEIEFAAIPVKIANWIIESLSDYKVKWEERCYMMYLPEMAFEQYMDSRPLLDSLSIEDLEWVNRYYTYKDDTSYDYLKACILKNPSSVIRDEQGTPISWALLREDGSLGVMYTVETHRQKGYAVQVAEDLICKTLNAGYVPYVHIRVENEASIALAKRLGMITWGEVLWFCLWDEAKLYRASK